MDLTERVKQVADEMGEAARKGASRIQGQLEAMRLRRSADDAAKRLGYLVHRERTGGVPGGAEADALVTEITHTRARLAGGDGRDAAEGAPLTTSPVEPAAPTPTAGQTPSPSKPNTRRSSARSADTKPATAADAKRTTPAPKPSSKPAPPPAPAQAPEEAAGE
jgi:hypothetical protein